MIADELMSRNLHSVEPSTPVVEAVNIMLLHHISGLPVVTREGQLVGILSEGDMLRRHEIGTDVKRSWWMDILSSRGHLAEDFIRANGRLVDEVMTREVVTIRRDTPLRDIVTLMETRKIKRLPVVENGQLVGIVSRADLLRALVRKLPQSPAASADDEQIRTAIFEQLSRQSWSANQYFQVRVCNGTVELSGTVFDEREKRAACILAENTPGVRAVQDNMDVVEPLSGTLISPPREDGTRA